MQPELEIAWYTNMSTFIFEAYMTQGHVKNKALTFEVSISEPLSLLYAIKNLNRVFKVFRNSMYLGNISLTAYKQM